MDLLDCLKWENSGKTDEGSDFADQTVVFASQRISSGLRGSGPDSSHYLNMNSEEHGGHFRKERLLPGTAAVLVTWTHGGQPPVQVTHTLGNIFGGGVFPGCKHTIHLKGPVHRHQRARRQGAWPRGSVRSQSPGTVASDGLVSRTQITGLTAR